jgi:hypothetical protein
MEPCTIFDRLREVLQSDFGERLMPFFRELNYRFGNKAELHKTEAEVADLIAQWEAIIRNSRPFSEVKNDGKSVHVLFVTGFGVGTAIWTRETILMISLLRRGCRITSLFCDMSLPACEFNSAGNHDPGAGMVSMGFSDSVKLEMCRRCAKNVRTTYSMFPIQLCPYHKFISDEDKRIARQVADAVPFSDYRSFKYADINLGEEVFASILRATFKGTVEDTALSRLLVKRFLFSGVLMCRMAERAFNELKPDRIVLPHGVYLTHGVATKIANKLNIPVTVYPGFGNIRKNTIMLSPGQTYHRTLIYENNSVWETVSLTPEQRQKTLDYSLSKQSGGVDIVNYHPNPIESEDHILKTLKIDKSRPIITLYTNVLWDAQIYYGGNAFENILEWMFLSIEELAKNHKIWAVIRIHPAEVKGGLPTRQPFLREIRKRFPVLPDNVRVIPPENNISSYTLAELSRAVVIYGTKLALELAVRGIPVIVCGECFSRGKGYSIDISSRQEYIQLLENVQNMKRLDQATIERAIKYAYYLYFRRMIPFPYIQIDAVTQRKRVAISRLEDLDAGRDSNLDAIANSIINLTPPYAPE